MKKRFLLFFLLPLILSGCGEVSLTAEQTVESARHTGEISDFNLTSPANGVTLSGSFTFTWEAAENADYYQLEMATTVNFVTDDSEEVYVRESNISTNKFELNYTLTQKDVLYYWRITAINKEHSKKCNADGNFFYKSDNTNELPIEIEDAQDWVLHKEGSLADISVDRSNFFGNNQNSLAIVFNKEDTLNGRPNMPNSKGWIVVTKAEDRELYGTDALYFNFYYSGHDSTVLVRFLDYDGEYWHCPVKIASNSKQTILMRYSDFTLRTTGTNIYNRKFDWQHVRYFEIVFERTFGDGVCLFSDIRAVQYENYKEMFMQKMNFNRPDIDKWTYESFDFEKTVSEDGNEITLGYTNGLKPGYGFQGINVYKYFVTGDAVRFDVKYTGSNPDATLYFRILEEDNDRWQFKVPFTYLIKNDYKTIVVPLKAFQRMDYMNGDGAKQFYYIQKFSIGLANNYNSGTLSVKNLEVVKIDDIVETRTIIVGENGMIEDFNSYDLYTKIYYHWDQSVENKDEAMKLDSIHKSGGQNNPYCGEFDYKADMEQAVYQAYLNTEAAKDKNAFSIWLKDATPNWDPVKFPNLVPAAELTIQLTLDSGEWYRYVIDEVSKDWSIYTIAFKDFHLNNKISKPKDLTSDHIIHIAFGLKYLYYDANGNHVPTYAIANPVYLDEISFVTAEETSIAPVPTLIDVDPNNDQYVMIDNMENYQESTDVFNVWAVGKALDYSSITLSTDVSKEGGKKSIKVHYKGSDNASYLRSTEFSTKVVANGLRFDVKGDGKVTLNIILYWRNGEKLIKMKYSVKNIPTDWARVEIGFENFADTAGTTQTMIETNAKQVEAIYFELSNTDGTESDIYLDNIIYSSEFDFEHYSKAVIS